MTHGEDDKPYTPDQSAWRERRIFHRTDVKLRAAGWQIWSRRPGQEAIWCKGGKLKRESEIEL